MLTYPLDQHFKSNGVLSALRDDHVGTALARLYELLVHRFYGRQVLRHNAVQGTAALFYIAQDPAENPHVRIGIDKDFDVHQIAEILLNEEENALEHDNRGRMDQNRFIRAVMHGIIVNRHLDGLSGFQLENVLA